MVVVDRIEDSTDIILGQRDAELLGTAFDVGGKPDTGGDGIVGVLGLQMFDQVADSHDAPRSAACASAA